jgi:hypothetical protein
MRSINPLSDPGSAPVAKGVPPFVPMPTTHIRQSACSACTPQHAVCKKGRSIYSGL